MSDDKPQLLPCRVCGRNDLLGTNTATMRIACVRCDVLGPAAGEPNERATLWNERCAASPASEVIDEMRRLRGIQPPPDAAVMTPGEALKRAAPGLTCYGVPVELIGQAWRGDWAKPTTSESVRLMCGVPRDAFIKTIPGVGMATMLVEGEGCVWCVPVIEKDKEDKP